MLPQARVTRLGATADDILYLALDHGLVCYLTRRGTAFHDAITLRLQR